jgi:hypothetical protein
MRILHPFGHEKKRNNEKPIDTRTERVGSTTPRTQPDTYQPLAIPLRMTHGADKGPDFFTGY